MAKRRALSFVLVVITVVLGFGIEKETDLITLSRAPGVYRNDLRIDLKASDGSIRLQYRFKESTQASFVGYRIPLYLTALEGEERPYTIIVQALKDNLVKEERNFVFVIDKKGPSAPEPSLPEGEYIGDRNLSFKNLDDAKVYFSLNPKSGSKFILWDGQVLSLKAGTADEATLVCAYAEDRAGNKSPAVLYRYKLKAVPESRQAANLSIPSPVPGTFLNPQILCVLHEGYDWIKYSLDGSDAVSGSAYLSPVRIEGEGRIVVKLAGKRAGDETIDRREIVFTQNAEKSPRISDGLLEKDARIDLSSFDADHAYCLEERTPKSFDARTNRVILLETMKGGLRTLPLRVKQLKETGKGEYRFFFILDGRIPGPVEVSVEGAELLSQERKLSLKAAQGTEIRYTLDGKDPAADSPRYEGPVSLSLPEATVGRLVVKARGFYGETRKGPVSERSFAFSTKFPSVKNIRSSEKSTSGFAFISADFDPAFQAVYELAWDGKDPKEPNLNSPRTSGFIALQVPYGYSREIAVKVGLFDAAGNLSVHPETFRFQLHRLAPEPPQIFIQDGVVRLEGKGQNFLRVREKGIPQGLFETAGFEQYVAPLALPVPTGKRVEYEIDAYALDDLGNKSEVIGPFFLLSDRRIPKIPVIARKIDPGKLVKDDYVLDFSHKPKDLELFYTFTEDGTEPPAPDASANGIDTRLVFQGKENKELAYWVKILSRYADSPEKGEVAEFRFVIDRLPPEKPEITGLPEAQIVNHGIELAIKAKKEEDSVLYRLRTIRGPKLDDSGYKLYEEPLQLSPLEGDTVLYLIDYEVKDPAGNSYKTETPLSVTIDQEAPKPPAYRILPGKPSKLELSSAEGKIFFTVSREGKLPAAPDNRSARYKEPLSFDSEAFDVFAVSALVIDEAGNVSKPLLLTDLVKHPELLIPESSAVLQRKAELIVLSFNDEGEKTFFHKDSGTGNFLLYDAPLVINVSNEKNRSLFYQSAGGKIQEYSIPTLETIPLPETLQNLSGRYASSLLLTKSLSTQRVHYEIAANGQDPKPVSQLSPVFEQELRFPATEGETVAYAVTLKAFSSDGTATSGPKDYSFTLDRTAPEPPVVEGVMNDHYYIDDRMIFIKSQEGTIFVSFQELPSIDAGIENIQPGSFERYVQPLSAKSEEGSLKNFAIHAYTEDSVGNRSLTVTSLAFTLDKAVLYLSPSGKDDQEGSRSYPLRSVDRALELLRSSKRTSLFLAKGSYTCDKPIESFKDFSLIGGFEENSWRKGDSTSIISFNAASGLPAVKVAKNSLILDSILLESSPVARENLLQVDSGQLSLLNCRIKLNGTIRALNQKAGNVTINRSDVLSENLGLGELILSRGGSLEITNSNIAVTKGDQTTLISVQKPGEISLSNSQLSGGEGLVTTAIHSLGALVRVKETKIFAGKGSLASLGIKSDGGVLSLNRLSLNQSEKAYISTGLSVISGKLDMQKSSILIGGQYGATGIYIKNCVATVTDSLFEGRSSEDFFYHFHGEESQVIFSGNSFSGGQAGDYFCSVLQDTSSVWKSNSITLGKGTVSTFGFFLKGKSSAFVDSNRLVFSDVPGVFLRVAKESTNVRIENNLFLGKKGVILTAEDPSSGWSRVPPLTTISDIDKLNGFVRLDGIFSGNRQE